MTDIEPRFKEQGHYLSRCHQWVGEPAAPGYLPGWSAHTECWWVLLPGAGPYGGRWIIAGFDRDAVRAAAVAKLAEVGAVLPGVTPTP